MRCDAERFAQMYEGVYTELYRFAICRLGNAHDAEDAVSEAVIAAYENIFRLRKPEAFKSWIFTILSNICKKQLKKRAKEQEERQKMLGGGHSDRKLAEKMKGEALDMGELLDIQQAFLVLSKEEQEVVGLSVFGGYNSQEIGRMLKRNPSTIRSKRSRALKKMECVLRAEGEGNPQ